MKTSYQKIIGFGRIARSYISSVTEETKAVLALYDVVDQASEWETKWQKIVKTKQRKYALEEQGTMALLKDANGNYKFTKKNEELLELELEELFEDETLVSYNPEFVDIPKGFRRDLIKLFTGFIFETAQLAPQD